MTFSKKIAAVSVVAALALPVAAQADITLYGQARLSVEANKNGETTAAQDGSAIAVSSNTSRIGVKGAEDLGDGMKAVYQWEREINFDDASNTTFKARNSFVGLAGDFGTVMMGVHDTPYKLATVSHDIMADTRGDYNALVKHDTRASNVIAYVSPDMNGFKVMAGYIPSYTKDDVSQTQLQSKQKGVSASVGYVVGGLDLSLAYENLQAANASAATGPYFDDKAIKLGVAYKIADTRLGLVWDKRSYNVADYAATPAVTANDRERKTLWLNVTQKVSDNSNLRVGYGKTGESASGKNDSANMITAGYFYNLHKNVEVYGLYAKVSNDDGGKEALKGVAAPKTPGAGFDTSSLSFGMNMKF